MYCSADKPLAAYATRDPGDGRKHPAIVWITGGDNNSIGDVWTPQGRENDQSAGGWRRSQASARMAVTTGGTGRIGDRDVASLRVL